MATTTTTTATATTTEVPAADEGRASPADTPPPESPQANAAALVDFLRTRGVPCPLCGYNPHRLLEPRCPECGRELVLSVGLTEPMLLAWITLTIALLLPAGTGV